MRATEFISERKKKKKSKRKNRGAAWGPGPYGWYGYDSGYSGDGGGDGGGGGESLQHEAAYEGNIGMMEVSKFFQIATSEQRILFKKLLANNQTRDAWQLIQAVTGVELKGKEFAENFADGKVKGKSRPGRVKKAGASCNGSVTDLRARAKKASGERAKMLNWCANMKSGKKK